MPEIHHPSESNTPIQYDEVLKPSEEAKQQLNNFVSEERHLFQSLHPQPSRENEASIEHLDHVMRLAQSLLILRDISTEEFESSSTVRWASKGETKVGVSILGIANNEVRASFWGVRWNNRRQGIGLNLLLADLAYLMSLPNFQKEFTVDVWEGSRALFEHPTIRSLGVTTEVIGERVGAQTLRVTLPQSTL